MKILLLILGVSIICSVTSVNAAEPGSLGRVKLANGAHLVIESEIYEVGLFQNSSTAAKEVLADIAKSCNQREGKLVGSPTCFSYLNHRLYNREYRICSQNCKVPN